MPSVFITTSRKTSNRVRSFVRDLSTVIPDSERFNRGSLNQEALFGKVRQGDAKALIVVTMFQGNPDYLMVYDSRADLILEINMESATLRREVGNTKPLRINQMAYLCVKHESSDDVHRLARFLSSLLNIEPVELSALPLVEDGIHQGITWLESTYSRIIWTHYDAKTGNEIGPRIRIKSIRFGS